MREAEQMPGHLARRFQQIAVSIFHAEVGACGCDLTPVQYAALVAICQRPGIDQITLAGAIAYDRTTITGVIDRLERKALVTREIMQADRRVRTLRATPAGKAMIHRIEASVEAAQVKLLSGLDAQEAECLIRLLSKATNALNNHSRVPLRTVNDR